MKYDITLEEHIAEPCSLNICTDDNQCEVTIADTEDLIKSDDNLKNKVIYIAGYLKRKIIMKGKKYVIFLRQDRA